MKSISKLCSLLFVVFVFSTPTAFAGQWNVKSGDSLSKIAANYPGVTAGQICKANSFMFKVKDCNHIEPGWLLVIPKVGDCFDATMTVASKQKIIDDWNRKVVSNYRDGKPDCNFENLSQKTKPVLVNNDSLNHINISKQENVDSSIEVLSFATLGNNGVVGVGALIKTPSNYALAYQFNGSKEGYSNQLLLGKYVNKDFAIVAGPRVRSDSSNNSDAVGIKAALLYTPKITDSFFGYAEVGISAMRVKEYQQNGTPKLYLNGNILSLHTPVVRKESNHWNGNLNVSVGIAYKF